MAQTLTSTESLFRSGTSYCSPVAGNKPHFIFIQLFGFRCNKHFLPTLLIWSYHAWAVCFQVPCWWELVARPRERFPQESLCSSNKVHSLGILSSKFRMGGQKLLSSLRVKRHYLVPLKAERQALELQGTFID